MSCDLAKNISYPLSRVERQGARVIAYLQMPPPGCPDGFLSSSKTQLKEGNVEAPSIAWSDSLSAPLVLVPLHTQVAATPDPAKRVDDSLSWGTWLVIIAAAWGAGYLAYAYVRRRRQRLEREQRQRSTASTPLPPFVGHPNIPSGQIYAVNTPASVVVQQGHSGTDLALGYLIGSSAHSDGGSSSHHSAPSESTSNSYSADTFSSSFSSDSSSFSSDSGGSFSSDSGGSFSSDT